MIGFGFEKSFKFRLDKFESQWYSNTINQRAFRLLDVMTTSILS